LGIWDGESDGEMEGALEYARDLGERGGSKSPYALSGSGGYAVVPFSVLFPALDRTPGEKGRSCPFPVT
jgi:hypothetical protein